MKAKPRLSHVDARGAARMVDVAAKPETARAATASAAVKMKRETLRLVERASSSAAAPAARRGTCWRWRGWPGSWLPGGRLS